MKNIYILFLVSLVMWACDSGSTGGVIYVDTSYTSSSEEFSFSEESSSSEIESSYSIPLSSSGIPSFSSSSKAKSSTSSKVSSSSSSKVKSSSSSSADKAEQSSSSVRSLSSATRRSSSSIVATEHSPIRVQGLVAHPNEKQTVYTFTGKASLDLSDSLANEDGSLQPFFTDIDLSLYHVTENGKNELTKFELLYTMPIFPANEIDITAMNIRANKARSEQCGTYKLYFAFFATNDSLVPDKFITIDSVEFVRDPIYCGAGSSSSAEIIYPTVELMLHTGTMSTSTNNGFSFKDDAEVPLAQAQIQVTGSKDGNFTLHGVNGYKVTLYSNQKDQNFDDDWASTFLPPNPTHMDDFRFAEANLADSAQNFDIDAFWIVVGPNFNERTGDDFYAVTLHSKDVPDANGLRPLEILYYKK